MFLLAGGIKLFGTCHSRPRSFPSKRHLKFQIVNHEIASIMNLKSRSSMQLSLWSRHPPAEVSVPLPLPVAKSISKSLFADLFQLPRVQSRYLDAPLLEERTAYIFHLLRHAVPRTRLKSTASIQLHAIKLLNLREARPIGVSEVQEAGSRWAVESALRKRTAPSKAVFHKFTGVVANWLAFSRLFIKHEGSKLPFEELVTAYLEDMQIKGYSEDTVYHRRRMLSGFQGWLGERHDKFAEISLNDIDDFLDSRRARGWGQTTLRHACDEVRVFIRYCESQNWCKAGIARGILTPSAVKPLTASRGPAWSDVRRMLRVVATNPAEVRENAIISLCSIYAMRRSEIVRMRLDDLDWRNEVMTVRRAKRGGLQQFPIQHEVGETILAYLKSRPKSNCRSLFTTLRAPIRPMKPNSIGVIVAKRMRMLDIKSLNRGPHALRHSCATELLNKGFTLQEIADFLGHRGLHAVSVYAKFNPQLLRRVACFNMEEIR
jgi:integrase/recombinase XerD